MSKTAASRRVRSSRPLGLCAERPGRMTVSTLARDSTDRGPIEAALETVDQIGRQAVEEIGLVPGSRTFLPDTREIHDRLAAVDRGFAVLEVAPDPTPHTLGEGAPKRAIGPSLEKVALR